MKSELEKDVLEFKKYSLYFEPTGTFQEISIPNGWGEDFILMANQFDELYEKIKAST